MERISLKIVGAAGQGIDSIGEIVAKGLKRAGYCVFGYREYASVIKGGHSGYQIDFSSALIRSTETQVNILIALNHHGLEINIPELKEGGVVVHLTPHWKFSRNIQHLIRKRRPEIIFLPIEEMLRELQAKPILGNVIITAFVWELLRQNPNILRALVKEKFGHKKDLLELNMRCIDRGVAASKVHAKGIRVKLPPPKSMWKKQLLLTGSKAMGLGAIHAGVRFYAGYPMTPSSPLLTFIADLQNQTGMVVKQAEDEITAAQMVSGAMFMGTRALTASSGGGFDLMSETISMNAIIENPTVFVLAQRPGPATGLPTWTAQGDLLMAVGTSHGEFPRCVLSVSDSQDCFDLMPVAFNLAEKYQISVIVLTDRQIAEALFTQVPFDQGKARIDRGRLVSDPRRLRKLKSTDRYDSNVNNGVSLRWLPGSQAETFCAQADEHDAEGTVNEDSENAKVQMEKRMRKGAALLRALPEPELYTAISNFQCPIRPPVQGLRTLQGLERRAHGREAISKNEEVDVLLIGWGSTKGPVLDALRELTTHYSPLTTHVGYLHYTCLWPLKTKRFETLTKKAKRVILVETNYQGQLGILLKQVSGIEVQEKILKYDGRPFFYNELFSLISSKLEAMVRLRSPQVS